MLYLQITLKITDCQQSHEGGMGTGSYSVCPWMYYIEPTLRLYHLAVEYLDTCILEDYMVPYFINIGQKMILWTLSGM